jgi:hypothetical protein
MSYFLEEEEKRREKQRVNNELYFMKQEADASRLRLHREIENIHEASFTYEDLQTELEPIIKRLEALEQLLKQKAEK